MRAEGRAFLGIGLISALALAGLIWLLYLAVPAQPTPAWARDLPGWNALCNGVSALAALIGWLAIRRGEQGLHRFSMVTALSASAAFLLGYVVYHHYHGDTLFGGHGFIRFFYFFVLISHVLLSTLVLPLLLSTVWLAVSGKFDQHRRLARWVWPLWMYVSVTGVVVYLLLKPYY